MDEKEEGSVVEDANGSAVELSFPAKRAYEGLKWPVKYACLVYNVLFQGLLAALEKSGEDVFERVQALICDPR